MSETPGWHQPDPAHGRTGEGQDPGRPPNAAWSGQAMPPARMGPGPAKPGVIPLRPLNLGEILDGAISTMRRHPLVMLGVAAVVVAISQLVALPLVSLLTDDINRMGSGELVTEDEVFALLGTTLTVGGVGLIITILARVFLTGFLTTVVGKAVLGHSAKFGEIWSTAKPKLLRLLGLILIYPIAGALLVIPVVALALVHPALGALTAIAVVIAAVWLYILFSLATPALVLEDTGIGRAFGRSRQLVRGSWWRVFGIFLLAALIAFFIAAIIQLPFELLGGDVNSLFTGEFTEITMTYLILTSIGTVTASTITEPFAAGVTALLYLDQRMRREGLDIELARAAGVSPRP
ncbi:MAG: hypothetical protein ACRDQ7_18240 [Haloechinothrix sp.]